MQLYRYRAQVTEIKIKYFATNVRQTEPKAWVDVFSLARTWPGSMG